MGNHGNKTRKRHNCPDSLQQNEKRRRTEDLDSNSEESYIYDWKLNMGASLADRLETIASEKKLTILQVKRLLKDVLTNPTVVSAFKQYMSGQLTLLEPETGATSTSTRRHAQILGFDLSALGPHSDIMDVLSRRSVTRSFAKKLKADLAKNNEETTGSKSTGPVAATLLDMNFSDEEDDKSRSPKSENANAPVEVETEVVSSASHVGCQRDEDYHPTADDLSLLRRDILYDMQDVEAKSESSRDEFEADFDDEDDSDSQNASFCTIEPFDTPHREYYLRSRKRDEGCLAGLTPNILHMLDEDDPDADAAERDAQRFADSFVAANTSTENDPEEQIYANFLQSLYSNSPRSETNVSTPHVDVDSRDPMLNHGTHGSVFDASDALIMHSGNGGLNDSKAITDDDPDFDVMAELEDVCYDDLFDELRSDRAVRVSKLEAKELRQDLVDLLNDDEEIVEFGTGFLTNDNAPSAEIEKRSEMEIRIASYPPLPPHPFDPLRNQRLCRQLSMYVQLLCSSLLCCSHRVDLEQSICDVVRAAFMDLHFTFNAAKSNPHSYVTGLANLNDTFTSAHKFMMEFAGLSLFPLPPPVNPNSAFNPPLIPLPFNLLDFVLRSPIWAYPSLLPHGLASRPHNLSKKFFTDDEDSLVVLGLANLIEFAPSRFELFTDGLSRGNRKQNDEKDVALANVKKAKVFNFITKTLLPTKTILQLHNRKIYIENAIQKDHFGIGRNAKSALYLLLCDLKSGNFEGVEAQRNLLRTCVRNFTQRALSANCLSREGGVGGLLQIGSIFSRPECWSLLPLEYKRCCMALQKQIMEGVTGAPLPTLEPLLPGFVSAAGDVRKFFLEAMLTWWPSVERLEEEREKEIEKEEAQEVRTENSIEKECDLPTSKAPSSEAPTVAQPSMDVDPPSFVAVCKVLSTLSQQPPQVSIANIVTPTLVVPSSLSSHLRSLSLSPAVVDPPASVVVSSIPIYSNPQPPATSISAVVMPKFVASMTTPAPLPPLTALNLGPHATTTTQTTATKMPTFTPRFRPILAKPTPKKLPIQRLSNPPVPEPIPRSRQKAPLVKKSDLNSKSPPFLPQVGKTINSFHVVLDRGLRGLAPPACNGSSLTARLLRRCRRESPAWLPNVPTAVKEADESDVRRARCLLDRIQMHLGRQVHTQIVLALREDPPSLQRILHLLSPSRPLWEEFVDLCLTHGQARSLNLYPTFAHLRRVGEIHSLLKASLPRATRLWSRLRKLADAREAEELRIPATEEAPSLSDSLLRRPKKRRRRRRGKGANDEEEEKQKPARDVYRSAWSLLETALKDRYSLHAQTAISLDPMQKPYSNFPQTFEVLDSLARKKMSTGGAESTMANLLQSESGIAPTLLSRLVEELSVVENTQWETSTELSSNAPTTTKSKAASRCPCPCHVGKVGNIEVPQSQTPSQNPAGGGRSGAKADSLGLRHCIRCSLRVQQGVLYVDECNFHLNRAKISWSEGYIPPSASMEASALNNIYSNPSSVPPTISTTTQQALQALETYHDSSPNQKDPTIVPDLARRQVSVNFEELVLPPAWKAHDLPAPILSLAVDQDEEEEEEDLEEVEDEVDSPGDDEFLFDEVCDNSPSFFQPPPIEVDDEACFNTEAFYQRYEGTDDTEDEVANKSKKTSSLIRWKHSSNSDEVESESPWSMAEDRRLLEYFHGVDQCTASHFRNLAADWPHRSPQELAARFKYLMLVAYGEDYTIDDLTKSLEQDRAGNEKSEV